VLLVDPVAQTVLDGVQVDCVETTDGDIELVLVAIEEDHPDMDAEEPTER
jgi:hypothetical protein